jgi:PEP-CTERM motif
MKSLRIGTFVAALSLMALPAHAADIGLVGGEFDPPPINDGQVYFFGSCDPLNNFFDTSDFTNSRCLFFDFADIDGDTFVDAVSSIELFIFGLEPPFFASEASELGSLDDGLIFEDALRLFGGTISPFTPGCEIECQPRELALFISPDEFHPTIPDGISAQVVAVNNIASVPEPATLLMLGPGSFAVFFFRRRMRSGARV